MHFIVIGVLCATPATATAASPLPLYGTKCLHTSLITDRQSSDICLQRSAVCRQRKSVQSR